MYQNADATSVELTNLAGEVIYTCTRQQLLEDGYLIDVTETAREAGFTIPVALTRAVWEDCVEWNEEDTKRQTYQDVAGRLWDVIYMACFNARINRNNTSFLYEIYRVPRGGKGKKARRVTLKTVIGPGDQGKPVITIMQSNED